MRRNILAASYAAIVGYDPFTDCPGIDRDEVAQTLRELIALHMAAA